MARLKLDPETLSLSSVLERITHSPLKDCFIDENDLIHVVVPPGEMGRALGKGGSNARRITQETGKRVKFTEFSDDVSTFIRNFIYPLQVESIEIASGSPSNSSEPGEVIIRDSSKKTKSLLIGREGKNLNTLTRAVKRFFNVDIKIV
jgi:N utilization substance protein A